MAEPVLCLCAEEITTTAIYPCKHIICDTCCLRLRALMNDKTCPYCRDVAVEQVSIVRNSSVKAVKAQIPIKKYGIMCETEQIKEKLEGHLSYPCPVCNLHQVTRKQFKQHFHDKHAGKNYCRVCEQHEYVFTDELEVYSYKELNAHIKSEHATCPFCNWNFYSNKELNQHCKTQHEICFICERLDASKPRYFENYLKLKDHFVEEHYMCMVPSCLEDKFIVFGSKIELQNHMLEQHKTMVNVKEMKSLDLNDLNAVKSRKTPSDENSRASTIRRYNERLRINGKNDSGIIDQIMQANHTFENKKVPVDVFIKTYESILTNASKDEITILLDEYSQFTSLSSEKKKQLDMAVNKRRPAEPASSSTSSQPSASGATSGSARLDPGPTPYMRMGAYGQWAGRKPTINGIDKANLPRLGAGTGTKTTPDILTRAPKIPVSRAPGIASTKNLPRLPSQPKPTWGQGPQTRLPDLGAPKSTRPTWMAPNDPWESPTTTTTTTQQPQQSSRQSTPLSTASSSASSSSTNLSRPNFGSLPGLPTVAPKKKGKKQAKVVRIV